VTVTAPEPVASQTVPRASREARVYLFAIVVFLAAAALTLYLCHTMSGGMEMPGGWTMSMMWMPMAGQGWLTAALMFLLMWLAMMVAMMLPSALPTIILYRRVLHFRRERHVVLATSLMSVGYFIVWLAFGAVAYGAGIAAAWATMRWDAASRAVPAMSGVALIVCGVFQFTPWKMSCLRHCRDPLHFLASHLSPGPIGGWKLGLHHGIFCAACCWGLMLIQLSLGIMNLAVMVIVAAVIALEKLVPRSEWIVWTVGGSATAGGLLLLFKA
jgi:predicted metal-binding membrane protein